MWLEPTKYQSSADAQQLSGGQRRGAVMISKAVLLLGASSKKCLLLLVLSIAMTLTGRSEGMAASDIEIQLYMSTELNNIPAYCQTKLAEVYFEKEYPGSERNNIKWPPFFSKNLNKYRNAIGPQNWIYFHHYCFGVKDYVTYNAKKSAIDRKSVV